MRRPNAIEVAGPAQTFPTRRAALPVLLSFVFASAAKASMPVHPVNIMSDPKVKIYDLYLSAWSAISDEERAARLKESLTETIVFANAMKTRRGLGDVAAHLQTFQHRMPGGGFVRDRMLGFETFGFVQWRLLGSAEHAGFSSGYDILTYAPDGRIASILMFVNIAKQVLE